jgi:hypothetical protein
VGLRLPSGLSWRKALPFMLGGLGLLAAGWAIRLNALPAPTPTLIPVPTAAPAGPDGQATEVDLPAFSPGGRDLAISRRTLLTTDSPTRSRVEVLLYTVQPGDSVFGIADKFAIKPESILWGNDETLNDDPHMIQPGTELNIVPVDGAYYRWKDGDTLASVAGAFDVDPSSIVEWPSNRLESLDSLVEPGTWIIIPGGSRPLKSWFVPTIARGSAGVGAAFGPGGCSGDFSGGAVGGGGFIWPSANHYLSGNDYWSGHLAVDIATGYGDPVWASDAGVVVYAGWSNTGYGNMVMIDHGTGWQTVYGHLSDVKASCGQSVGQGQVIGHAGSTGTSTGTHLHFESRYDGGFVSPWSVLP